MTESPTVSAASQRRPLGRARLAAIIVGWLAFGFLVVFFMLRPDTAAAVTFWPPWGYALAGALASVGMALRRPRRPFLFLAAGWLLFLILFAEEPRSLMRIGPAPSPEWTAARSAGRALRVVSLNCAGGSEHAARETGAVDPDIVLLQESPSRRDVADVGRSLFGREAGIVPGLDGSVVSRWKAGEIQLPNGLRSIAAGARVRLSVGGESVVISARLLPPEICEALWSPACWRRHTANRVARREQMRALGEALPEGVPTILGGDFNAPAGDAVFRLLPTSLHDTFAAAGRGWGNTIINEIPVLRIDQIWVSRHFRPESVTARRTKHSDHRMVVCDLWIIP